MGCWDTITHVWMCSNHWGYPDTDSRWQSHWMPGLSMGCWDTITHIWMCSNHWAIQTLTQGDSHTECLAFQWAAGIPSHMSGCVLTTGLSRHWLKVTVTLNAWPFDGLLRYHHTGQAGVLTTGLTRHWLKVTVTLNAWPFNGLLGYHHTCLDVF